MPISKQINVRYDRSCFSFFLSFTVFVSFLVKTFRRTLANHSYNHTYFGWSTDNQIDCFVDWNSTKSVVLCLSITLLPAELISFHESCRKSKKCVSRLLKLSQVSQTKTNYKNEWHVYVCVSELTGKTF